jgi:hypothetical protein
MKIYTEEQLLNTAEAIRDYLKNYPEKFHESMIKKHLTSLAPIEIPSDKEINETAYGHSTFSPSFVAGAKWMLSKIQGDSK